VLRFFINLGFASASLRVAGFPDFDDALPERSIDHEFVPEIFQLLTYEYH